MRLQLLTLFDQEKQEEQKSAHSRNLHEAAMEGSLPSLPQTLDQTPLILTSSPRRPSSSTDTPLHVAALLGHLDFVKSLLTRNPDLAGKLNSDGSTPLHLASAKGYAEIVRELVSVNPDVGFVLDRDGRSPFHIACIKGRVGVLTELLRVNPELAQVVTGGGGESCLHLCVKYNRLEALKVVVEGFGKNEFVNWKDGDGNTVLHLAVAKKQLEIIKFLLVTTAIEVGIRNAHGLTALDVLSQSPRDLRDMEIKQCLHGGGVSTRFNSNGEITEVFSIRKKKELQNGISIKEQPKKHKHTDWLGRKRSSLMVVASLIATVAFQAAISPPGGVWQNDSTTDSNGESGEKASHEAGQSVMAYNIPEAYGQFMIFDTIAFLASLSIILLQVSGLPIKRRRWMWVQMVTMWIAITAQTITYFITLIHMTPKNVRKTLYEVTKISVLTWLLLIAIVFIGNLVRVIMWLLRKYGYIKEEEDPNNGDDDENDDL
ncbi:hypothetical protein RHSIM_Rhsim07G0188200 [Rhododendron simsii]|uniref:PGG domain-containing protein n=1 Tax=Rhododendron simsii TaxID=118357 RepID=A0A834LIV2_RHOSS|nr:hypothetical protein RHSIM_Rhsim07G0188200 [Rhododendron simsii]